jgi:hypothetical protein
MHCVISGMGTRGERSSFPSERQGRTRRPGPLADRGRVDRLGPVPHSSGGSPSRHDSMTRPRTPPATSGWRRRSPLRAWSSSGDCGVATTAARRRAWRSRAPVEDGSRCLPRLRLVARQRRRRRHESGRNCRSRSDVAATFMRFMSRNAADEVGLVSNCWTGLHELNDFKRTVGPRWAREMGVSPHCLHRSGGRQFSLKGEQVGQAHRKARRTGPLTRSCRPERHQQISS